MDRLERVASLQVSASDALRAARAEVWTALPGILQSFSPEKMTAVVQPAIQARVQQRDGSWENVSLPLLVDCPVVFPGGGGFLLTFPLAEGDEVLVVFAKNCVDAWWQQGGVQPQAEVRMHDLSDGFAIPRVWSQVTKPGDLSTTATQLRTADGVAYLELGPDGIVLLAPKVRMRNTAGDVYVEVDEVQVNLVGPVMLNTGSTPVQRVNSGSLAWAGAAIGAFGASGFAVSVPGSLAGDVVILGHETPGPALVAYTPWVNPAGTVSVNVLNPSAAPVVVPPHTVNAITIGV